MDKYLIADSILGRVGILTKDSKQIPVIYYHSIVETKGSTYMYVNYNKFCGDMLWLKENGYKTLKFSDLNADLSKELREKVVVIAFDDGYKDNYTLIFKFMKENAIKYNIFLAVGSIGIDDKYLSWQDIRAMYQSGLVDFGAHTYSHIDSRLITDANFSREVLEANAIIHRELGVDVSDFCLPFGYYNDTLLNYLDAKRCYKRVYTSDCRETFKDELYDTRRKMRY